MRTLLIQRLIVIVSNQRYHWAVLSGYFQLAKGRTKGGDTKDQTQAPWFKQPSLAVIKVQLPPSVDCECVCSTWLTACAS